MTVFLKFLLKSVIICTRALTLHFCCLKVAAVNHQNHQVGHVPVVVHQNVTVVHVPVAANTVVHVQEPVPVPEAIEAVPVHTTVVPAPVPVPTIHGADLVRVAIRAIDVVIDAVAAVFAVDTTIAAHTISRVFKTRAIIPGVGAVAVAVIIIAIRGTTIVIFVVDGVGRTIITVGVHVDRAVASKGVAIGIIGIVGTTGVGHVIAAGRTVVVGRESRMIR